MTTMTASIKTKAYSGQFLGLQVVDWWSISFLVLLIMGSFLVVAVRISLFSFTLLAFTLLTLLLEQLLLLLLFCSFGSLALLGTQFFQFHWW
jgi:uncharacterized membrane protein